MRWDRKIGSNVVKVSEIEPGTTFVESSGNDKVIVWMKLSFSVTKDHFVPTDRVLIVDVETGRVTLVSEDLQVLPKKFSFREDV